MHQRQTFKPNCQTLTNTYALAPIAFTNVVLRNVCVVVLGNLDIRVIVI